MIIGLNQQEIKQIILEHIENKGFDGVKIEDIFIDDELNVYIDIKDNVPYEPISYPICSKLQGASYPRCMSLNNQRYCTRVGGVC